MPIPMILHVTREQDGGEGDASVRGTGRGRGTLFILLYVGRQAAQRCKEPSKRQRDKIRHLLVASLGPENKSRLRIQVE